MKWLTLQEIKEHLGLEQDYTEEDNLLERYARSSENRILNILNRTKDELEECYGEVPDDVVHASLLLVEQSYRHRSPGDVQKEYEITYGFEAMVKPYIKLI